MTLLFLAAWLSLHPVNPWKAAILLPDPDRGGILYDSRIDAFVYSDGSRVSVVR